MDTRKLKELTAWVTEAVADGAIIPGDRSRNILTYGRIAEIRIEIIKIRFVGENIPFETAKGIKMPLKNLDEIAEAVGVVMVQYSKKGNFSVTNALVEAIKCLDRALV
ncbi:MAG: hypothetical protein WC764_02990 [Candidatus Paceibacterota bacterium]